MAQETCLSPSPHLQRAKSGRPGRLQGLLDWRAAHFLPPRPLQQAAPQWGLAGDWKISPPQTSSWEEIHFCTPH